MTPAATVVLALVYAGTSHTRSIPRLGDYSEAIEEVRRSGAPDADMALEECLGSMVPFEGARRYVLEYARREMARGARQLILLEASNNTEPAYAYTLVIDRQTIVKGLTKGRPARELRVLPFSSDLLASPKNFGDLAGSESGQSHGRCQFLTLVSGSRVKVIAVFGSPASRKVSEVLEELGPLMEGVERLGPATSP